MTASVTGSQVLLGISAFIFRVTSADLLCVVSFVNLDNSAANGASLNLVGTVLISDWTSSNCG